MMRWRRYAERLMQDYDFEYEEDDDDQDADAYIENKYYNAKGTSRVSHSHQRREAGRGDT